MPSRKRARQSKKMKTLTAPSTPNHHSSSTLQLQGKCDREPLKEQNGSLRPICEKDPYLVVEEEKSNKKGYSLSAGALVSANPIKMEDSFSGTSEETQKVESLTEDKEVVVEEIKSSFDFGVEAAAADDKPWSLTETQEGDSTITDEEAKQSEESRELVDSSKVEVIEDVSESVLDSFELTGSSANGSSDAIKAPVYTLLPSDTVELELMEEPEKIFPSSEEADGHSPVVANDEVQGLDETELPPSEENIELSSVSGNEGLRETELFETIKDLTSADEVKLPSLPPTDVASKEALETTVPKSDEGYELPPTLTEAVPKGIEQSLLPSADEEVGEPSDVQKSPKESDNESFQPSANVPAAETTSASVEDKAEIRRSTENPAVVSETQRQYTSWRSCCGLFEVLRRGDR